MEVGRLVVMVMVMADGGEVREIVTRCLMLGQTDEERQAQSKRCGKERKKEEERGGGGARREKKEKKSKKGFEKGPTQTRKHQRSQKASVILNKKVHRTTFKL